LLHIFTPFPVARKPAAAIAGCCPRGSPAVSGRAARYDHSFLHFRNINIKRPHDII